MLSSMDDYPIHQIAAPIRHVGTSDRNFYDRYYFNLHGSTDELFMVIGMGQYPNLATQDAFACVCSNGKQRVLRASKELGDRMDTTVGPFRVEVIEPLHARARHRRADRAPARVRPHLDRRDPGLRGAAALRPLARPRDVRQPPLRADRATGKARSRSKARRSRSRPTAGRAHATARGACGPSARPSPPASAATTPSMAGMWNYAPMQFDDYSLLYIVQEEPTGHRALEEAVRIWNDPARGHEWLGRPEFEHTLEPGHPHDPQAVEAVVPATRRAAASTSPSRRCGTRTSRSAPATAWTTNGGTACTRARSSCSTASGRRTSSKRGAGTASSTTSPASRRAPATSATACTSTASSARSRSTASNAATTARP